MRAQARKRAKIKGDKNPDGIMRNTLFIFGSDYYNLFINDILT